MDRLSEIRARCNAAKAQKEKGDSITAACIAWSIVINDVPYLLEQLTLSKAREHPQNLFLELTPQQRAENAEIVALTARAEKAEAERDKANKCIYDTETYFDLGTNKFAYRTIKQYTHDVMEAKCTES